jgi:CxxC-x17-CxxC domain-containing protein
MSEYKRKGPNRSQSRNNNNYNRDRNSNRSDRRNASENNRESRDSGRFNRDDSANFQRIERTRVTCDSCHKQCEVPFKPTSNKPVYCDNCFNKNKSSDRGFRSDRGSSRDFEPRSRDSGNSDLLKDMNRKLDKIMKELDIE